MVKQERRPPGRPRKWTTEAERKRAYRARRAAELADPLCLRQQAQAARAAAAAALTDAVAARRALQRAEQRAQRAERRVAKLVQRLGTTQATAARARKARDEAQRLLNAKARWAKDAHLLRDDPDALIAMVGEQARLLDWYRQRVANLERSRRPPGNP